MYSRSKAEEVDDADAKISAAQLRSLREQKRQTGRLGVLVLDLTFEMCARRPMSSFVSTSREYINALAGWG
jgi:hypothetical protein